MDAFPIDIRALLSRAQWRPCLPANDSGSRFLGSELFLKSVCHTVHGIFVVVTDFAHVGLAGSLTCHDALAMVQTAAPGIVISQRETLRLFDDALVCGGAILAGSGQWSLRLPVTVTITQLEHVVLPLTMPLTPAVACGPFNSGVATLHEPTASFLMDVGVVPLAAEAHALRHVLQALVRLRRIDDDDLVAVARQSLLSSSAVWQQDSATPAALPVGCSSCVHVPPWLDVVRQLCCSTSSAETGSSGQGAAASGMTSNSRDVVPTLRAATHTPNHVSDNSVDEVPDSSRHSEHRSRRRERVDGDEVGHERHELNAPGTAMHSVRPAKSDELMKKYRKALR